MVSRTLRLCVWNTTALEYHLFIIRKFIFNRVVKKLLFIDFNILKLINCLYWHVRTQNSFSKRYVMLWKYIVSISAQSRIWLNIDIDSQISIHTILISIQSLMTFMLKKQFFIILNKRTYIDLLRNFLLQHTLSKTLFACIFDKSSESWASVATCLLVKERILSDSRTFTGVTSAAGATFFLTRSIASMTNCFFSKFYCMLGHLFAEKRVFNFKV